MKKVVKIGAIAALTIASASASAWWGDSWDHDGFDDFFGDFFGDGDFDMYFHASGDAHGHNYWRNRYYDYYGYGPYGYAPYYVPAAPVAPAMSEEQRKAAQEQYAKAIEAQRKAAEAYAKQQAEFFKQFQQEPAFPEPPAFPPSRWGLSPPHSLPSRLHSNPPPFRTTTSS